MGQFNRDIEPRRRLKKNPDREFDFEWLERLEFETPAVEKKVLKESAKAIRKRQITEKEKFLGINFHREIVSGYCLDLSVQWIDERIGYGVFAKGPIPSGSFIGEYLGVVRKRRGRKDRSNDYTFEYAIGEWIRNPFIIDAKEKGNITRLINHSKEPNLESVSVYADGKMHIILIAIKPIPKGAQLTYDYGATYWKKRQARLLDNVEKFHLENES